MTTEQFLKKYPMVEKTDVIQLTSLIRLQMIEYYEDISNEEK